MSRSRRRRLVSWLLIVSGVVLVFVGAREFLESRVAQWEAAESYEQPLPNLPSKPTLRPSLPLGQPFAKLTIPRLDAELYVVEGVGKRELRRGPGHMAGTALPGENGNCIIAGHRDTHFRVLKDIREGDDVLLETEDGEFLYRVRRTNIVLPTNTESLQDTEAPVLNLITCYPFYYVGSAPKRFIVQAELSAILPAGDRPPS
jgi:sortase A